MAASANAQKPSADVQKVSALPPKTSAYGPRVDVRRFSYTLLANVYRDYYTSHTPPPNVRIDYFISESDVFTEAMGNCVLLVNKNLAGSLSVVCEIAVDHMRHDVDSFISYLKWRSTKLNFYLRSDILSLCSLISHLILHYFQIGCFRFSRTAAQALTEIIESDDLLSNYMGYQNSFNGFEQYCKYFALTSQNKKTASLIDHQPEDFEKSSNEFPEDLLDWSKSPIVYGCVNADETEDEANIPANCRLNRRIVLVRSKLESADPASPSKFSLLANWRTKFSPRKNYVCKLCQLDCRSFLKDFVDEFKKEYC